MKGQKQLLRNTRFEVNLDVIRKNFTEVRRMLKGRPVKIACVLKANAYGHGAVAVAGELLAAGADMLAVAFLGEALELRRRYPHAGILVMGHTPDELLPLAVRNRITLTVFQPGQAEILSRAAAECMETAVIHVKLDTGMNRLGMKESDNPVEAVKRMAALGGLKIEGLFTHLALRDRESDLRQSQMFFRTATALESAGIRIPLRHMCDSIGFMRYPEFRLDMVRIGAALFGVRPLRVDPEYDAYDLRPSYTFKTTISRIRRLGAGESVSYDDSWVAPPEGALVATLPVGYADGYMRCLSNKAQVLVRGMRAPVVGLVCMDQLNVDVSSVPGACEGDEVILLGGGSDPGVGDSGIPVMELARHAGTNRNEILAIVGRRVPRVYVRSGEITDIVDYLD